MNSPLLYKRVEEPKSRLLYVVVVLLFAYAVCAGVVTTLVHQSNRQLYEQVTILQQQVADVERRMDSITPLRVRVEDVEKEIEELKQVPYF
jgi:hypothetical protein